jgi:inosine-uridine nucleoside N-ribohydrolase
MLKLPTGPMRVVIDTDAKNEIDDQFALAWAFLSTDQLNIEAVYAAPFSWQYRIDELREAQEQMAAGRPMDEDIRRLNMHFAGYYSEHDDLDQIQEDGPDIGMERSYEEILLVFEKMGLDWKHLAYRGSDRFLTDLDDPVRSAAAEHLIDLAKTASPDDPIYVVAIGAVTNVASALLIAPEIINNIVVTWTSAFPTSSNRANYSFNLEQDMPSSQLMFSSGVPLVYLPGYHIGAQLSVSLPEMERWVKGRGAIGDYLHELYVNNPLHERRGISDHFGRTWIVWDLINVAWLLNPDWVPSEIVPAPILDDDKIWYRSPASKHIIREAYDINRDAIYRDFFTKLARVMNVA